MNNCIEYPFYSRSEQSGNMEYGTISDYDRKAELWTINGSISATTAVSLLVRPEIGDLAGFMLIGGRHYILNILERHSQTHQEVPLSIESQVPLRISAPEVCLFAWEGIDLVSADRIAVSGQHASVCVSGSLVHQAENLLQQVGNMNVTAEGLLRLNGQQQVITAEEDVRIDGKRINMG